MKNIFKIKKEESFAITSQRNIELQQCMSSYFWWNVSSTPNCFFNSQNN